MINPTFQEHGTGSVTQTITTIYEKVNLELRAGGIDSSHDDSCHCPDRFHQNRSAQRLLEMRRIAEYREFDSLPENSPGLQSLGQRI